MITYDDFKKVEIRSGKILSAEKIPETDKLLKLMVDFGEVEEVQPSIPVAVGANSEVAAADPKILSNDPVPAIPKVYKSKPRQIVSGIALKFPDVASLVGKTCMFVTNLEPRTIKGHVSNGMLFAVSTPEGGFSLLEPNATIPPGTLAI